MCRFAWPVLTLSFSVVAVLHPDQPCGCASLHNARGRNLMFERGFDAARAHRAPDDLAERLATPPRRHGRDELTKPVLAELRRSIRAHRAATPLLELQRALEHEGWVLVYEGRIYVKEDFCLHTKHPGHLFMMKEAVDLVGLPNALYAFSASTAGPRGCSELQKPLIFGINKQVGYEQCGALMPNTYFGGGNMSSWASESAKAAVDWVPFQNRSATAFYRGTLNKHSMPGWNDHKSCTEFAYGNYARIHAFAAARRAPDRVDAACTSDDCVGDATCTVRCPVPPPSCVGLVEDFNSGLRVGEDVAGETVGLDTFRRHKYLLNLPGGKSGSYSKNINHLWRTEAVVLQWVAPFVEWYFPAMRDFENHVVVAQHSIDEIVAALEQHPETAEAIGRAGRDIHDVFLCPRCIAGYIKTVLEEFRAHLNISTILDDPEKASAFFREHLPCNRMVEVVAPTGKARNNPDKKLDLWTRKFDERDPAHPCHEGGPAPSAAARLAHEWEHEAAVRRDAAAEAAERLAHAEHSGSPALPARG